jgi:hypothetical protein
MLDLAVLLSIAFAVTALLGLLLAGFVWVPWLIGVLLVGLLVALTWFVKLTTPPGDELDELLVEQAGFAPQGSSLQSSSLQSKEMPSPVMVYRGVKYQSSPTADTAASTESSQQEQPEDWHQGLYRGQPWKHSTPQAEAPDQQEGLYRGQRWKH